jgi:chitinase
MVKFIKWITAMVIYMFSASLLAGPLSCMKLSAQTGGWTPKIILENACGEPVAMQNSLLSFRASEPIGGSYWGSFGSLAYPQETLISHTNVNGQHEASLQFKFPAGNQWWKPNATLQAGEKINVQFSGTPTVALSNLSFSTESSSVIRKGRISFVIPENPTGDGSLKPSVSISDGNGVNMTLQNASFNSTAVLDDVPFGSYQVSIQTLDANGEQFKGNATPSTLILNSLSGSTVTLAYTKIAAKGALTIRLNESAPVSDVNDVDFSLEDKTSGQLQTSGKISFPSQQTIANLLVGHRYQLNVSEFEGKDYRYLPNYSLSNDVLIEANKTAEISVNFTPVALEKSIVNVTLSGLPTSTSAEIRLTDSKGYQYAKTLTSGHATFEVPVARLYQVSAPLIKVDNKTYKASLDKESFMSQSGQSVSLNISYQEQLHQTHFSPYVDVTLGTVTKWDSTTQSMQPVGLLEMVERANLNSLHLAFITGQAGCKGTWAGYPVENAVNGYGVPVFKELKARGVKLNVALGGLSGQYLAQVCDSEQALVAAYQEIIDAYNPDRLDFDVENALQMDNAKLQRMMSAIKTIKANNQNIPISFTLPVLPEGLVPGVGHNVIVQAQIAGLKDYGVNIMAMDYGNYYNQKTMGEYAIDALTATFSQLKALYPTQSDDVLWSRLEVTPMIGLNDTIPQNFSLNDVDIVKEFAHEKGLRMLSIWSLTRDKPCNHTYASPLCSSQNPVTGEPNQSQDYEFSLRFQ